MLTPMMIEQIEKFLPEDRILKKYEELKENIDKLDNSEQFLVMVIQPLLSDSQSLIIQTF